MKIPRPVMRYHGGKWRLASWVISHFPPHLTYVELFGGSAAVMLQKPRSRTEIYNDLSRDVVRTFLTIRRHPAELARALALTPYARSEYATLYDETDDDIEAARRFIARSFMGQNSKGAFRRSGFDARNNEDHFIARVRSLAAVPDQIAIVAGRLSQVLFENCDAIELVARHVMPETLVYADPPYLNKRNYYPDRFGIQKHCELLDALAASPAMVIISSYRSELYTELLPGWETRRARARTDTSSRSSARTEMLWINPAAAAAISTAQAAE
jgi:DNA adenine methylase